MSDEPYLEPGSSAELANWNSQKFNGEDVETGLQALIYAGSAPKAAEMLAEIGIDVTPSTLLRWKNTMFPDRFHELLRERGREIEERSAGTMRSLVQQIGEIEELAWERTRQMIEEGNPRIDPSQVAQRAAVAKGINNDHNLKLTGRPTQITEHRDPNEILRSLGAIAGLVTVENEADVQSD